MVVGMYRESGRTLGEFCESEGLEVSRVKRWLRRQEETGRKGSLPDLESATIHELTEQVEGNFGKENVEVIPLDDRTAVAVEINLPDRSFQSHIKVQAPGAEEDATET